MCYKYTYLNATTQIFYFFTGNIVFIISFSLFEIIFIFLYLSLGIFFWILWINILIMSCKNVVKYSDLIREWRYSTNNVPIILTLPYLVSTLLHVHVCLFYSRCYLNFRCLLCSISNFTLICYSEFMSYLISLSFVTII